jgi:uncharacterized sodium:solute symporter family permease YidK
MDAMGSARLDRTGRILVRLGGLVAVVLVALPAIGGLALFTLIFASGEGSLCATLGCHPLLWVLALLALGVVVAVIATIRRMLRGGTVALVLGSIGGFIVGVRGVLTLASEYQQGEEPGTLFAGFLMVVGLAGGALALGSALRLIARRQARREG